MGVAAGAGLGLLACGGGDEDEAPTGETPVALTPKPGGKATVAVSADVGSFDPHTSLSTAFVGPRLYSTLVVFNAATQEMIPLVAESVEQPDNLTYIWKIRPGVRFHNIDPMNGREVTADDVAFSFDRFKGISSMNDKVLLTLFTDSFAAVDPGTFQLKTTRPYATALSHTGLAQFSIAAPEGVQKWGDLSLNAAGCGPWLLDSYTRAERLILKKNPDYFRSGLPHLDEEEWLIIPDKGTLWQMLRTGRMDLPFWLDVDKFKREEIKDDPTLTLVKNPDVSPPLYYTRIDQPPLNDERVWEALDLAMDRDDLIEKLFFGEGNYNGPVPWTLDFWSLPQDELRKLLPYDPEKAKQLLSAAGYADGFDLDAPVRNDDDALNITTIIADQYRKVGIKVNITPKDVGVWLADLFGGTYQMTISRTIWIWEPEFLIRYYHTKSRTGSGNSTKHSDPELDVLIDGLGEYFDVDERREKMLELQRLLIAKHTPMHPLCTGDRYVAHSSKLKGVDPTAGVIYWSGTDYWREEA